MYHIERLDQRIIRIIISILAALCLIGGRLFYLQITYTEHYHQRGLKNYQRLETMQSRRGNIRDCSGALLATNRPVTHVYWQGTGNRSLSQEQLHALSQLGQIIEIPILENSELLQQISSREKYYKRTKIATDISFEQLSKIEEQFSNHPNLSLVTHFERHYPHGTCASHVLGYLGRQMESEALGQMGLEKLCEQNHDKNN